jgi:histidinol-phosphatase
MDPDLRVALDLAGIADEIAVTRFGGHLHVQRKPDGSMVTDVDRDVETALREHLERVRPGDAVLGEEFGGPASGERRWVLDPLDGTGRYVRGGRDWGTIVALVRDGDVAVGVMTQPARGRSWWAARGEGAWSSDGRRLHVSDAPALATALFCADHRGSASRGGRRHPGARLIRHCGGCRPPRGMPNALVVAEGGADLCVQVASPWDLAAGKVIVEEAGGAFTDINGRRRFDTGSALVSNGLVHDEALRALRDG